MFDFSEHPLIETDWLADHLTVSNLRIVDMRWRSDGTGKEIYQAGHIPGAIHLDWHRDLNWTYFPLEELRDKVTRAGIEPEQRVITYCGVGISASLGLFALYLAGDRNVALYDASWEEWGTDPKRSVEMVGRNDS